MPGHVTPGGFRLGATSRSVGLGALSVVVLLAVWHLVTAGGYISAIFLPSPQQVVGQARRYLADGSLFWHVVNRLDYALTVARLSILDTLAGPEPETPPTQSLENVGLACPPVAVLNAPQRMKLDESLLGRGDRRHPPSMAHNRE